MDDRHATSKLGPSEFAAVPWRSLIAIAVFVIVLAAAAYWALDKYWAPSSGPEEVKYLEQYIKVAQFIFGGVMVALLVPLISSQVAKSSDWFTRFKESRRAYSRAKTAVLYLSDKVLGASPERAFELISEAHRELHFAETFEDLIVKGHYLKWFDRPDLWITYNYWRIIAVVESLRAARDECGESIVPKALNARMTRSLKVVDGCFGRSGELASEKRWPRGDRHQWRKSEDGLQDDIMVAVNGKKA
jgi:hypothetical protein